jgi:hypothetical protein
MTVDLAEAEANGLTMEHDGQTYASAAACLLDFRTIRRPISTRPIRRR